MTLEDKRHCQFLFCELVLFMYEMISDILFNCHIVENYQVEKWESYHSVIPRHLATLTYYNP